jgi:Zn-finger nucleic acid-binding protein
MKANSISTNKLSFELKYCERCGGLWLRPVDGEQIYCVACGRAMAELPPASTEAKNRKMPRDARGKFRGYEEKKAIETGVPRVEA